MLTALAHATAELTIITRVLGDLGARQIQNRDEVAGLSSRLAVAAQSLDCRGQDRVVADRRPWLADFHTCTNLWCMCVRG